MSGGGEILKDDVQASVLELEGWTEALSPKQGTQMKEEAFWWDKGKFSFGRAKSEAAIAHISGIHY